MFPKRSQAFTSVYKRFEEFGGKGGSCWRFWAVGGGFCGFGVGGRQESGLRGVAAAVAGVRRARLGGGSGAPSHKHMLFIGIMVRAQATQPGDAH